jgi:predicted O-methyltransferase YrrM
MTEFWKTIPHDLFDYQEYYDNVAFVMPDNCRLAEVGCADGASGVYLAEQLRNMGKKFTLRMIDNLDYGRTGQLRTLYDNVYKGAGFGKEVEIVPLDSLNASLKYPDEYFDFVFIDTGHTYELTKAELRLWWRKVKNGGALAGHDTHIKEVTDALNEVAPNAWDEVKTTKGWGVWHIYKEAGLILK